MLAIVEATRRTFRTEWKYTFLSARREWSTRRAFRMFVRELAKGIRDIPAYAAELRG